MRTLKIIPLKIQLLSQMLISIFFSLVLMLRVSPSYATLEIHQFDNPVQESQYQGLIEEFRCPKCQNQNLAGSDAPIAIDLKQRTYELVMSGKSDAEIRDYMISRYGEFISYRPPFRPATWILWLFPPFLLVIALLTWVWSVRSRKINTDIPNTLSEDEQRRLDTLLDDAKNEPITQEMKTCSLHLKSDSSTTSEQ